MSGWLHYVCTVGCFSSFWFRFPSQPPSFQAWCLGKLFFFVHLLLPCLNQYWEKCVWLSVCATFVCVCVCDPFCNVTFHHNVASGPALDCVIAFFPSFSLEAAVAAAESIVLNCKQVFLSVFILLEINIIKLCIFLLLPAVSLCVYVCMNVYKLVVHIHVYIY